MGFILAPLAFVFIALTVVYWLLRLLVGDVAGYTGLVFLNNPPVLSDELQSIFEPLSEDISLEEITFPGYETIYGRIEIESVGIDCPLVYGDSDKALRGGAGQYIGSFIVGYGGTTLIAGHNNRHFETLPQVKEGDVIKITTSYGVYRYRITSTAIKSDTDTSAYDLRREDENVILYTCIHEMTPVGDVKKRFYVYGDYMSGPMLKGGRG